MINLTPRERLVLKVLAEDLQVSQAEVLRLGLRLLLRYKRQGMLAGLRLTDEGQDQHDGRRTRRRRQFKPIGGV